MVGGFLFIHAGWHAIFWLLTGVGVVLFVANWQLLPETLHEHATSSRSTRATCCAATGAWRATRAS